MVLGGHMWGPHGQATCPPHSHAGRVHGAQGHRLLTPFGLFFLTFLWPIFIIHPETLKVILWDFSAMHSRRHHSSLPRGLSRGWCSLRDGDSSSSSSSSSPLWPPSWSPRGWFLFWFLLWFFVLSFFSFLFWFLYFPLFPRFLFLIPLFLLFVLHGEHVFKHDEHFS